MKQALSEGKGKAIFYANANIVGVSRIHSGYELFDDQKKAFLSPTPPILATGFHHALTPIRELWEWKEGHPVFSEEADESTLFPGIFYSGPSLSHRGMLFCFIYKFRARFGIIARTLASRLGYEWETPLLPWRERGFMLDDLACCVDCQCAVRSDAPVHPQVVSYSAH